KSTSTPADFPIRSVSVVNITDKNANGFPEGTGGVLETNRITGDDSSTHQKYVVRGNNNEYYRDLTIDKSNWSEWRPNNGHVVLDIDSITSNTTPKNLPYRSVSVVAIRSNNASGFPEERAGVLTSYNLDSDGDFVYQEYYLYNA